MIDRLTAKLQNEAELRAFYQSVGVSSETTEAAIKVMNQKKKPKPPHPTKKAAPEWDGSS